MVVAAISAATGIGEINLRLLMGMFAGYPLALLWRFLSDKGSTLLHIYSALSGFLVCAFVYEADVIYPVISVVVTIAILLALPAKLALPAGWLFNAGFLLWAYIVFNDTTDYVINWTTAQCVLCLRLMGLCFDVADGKLPEEKMGADVKAAHLKKVPNPLKIFGFCFHFGGFLVGPQFCFRKYEAFVDGTMGIPNPMPSSGSASWKCLGTGMFYLLLSQALSGSYGTHIVFTREFLSQHSLAMNILYICLGCRVFLWKYLGIWKIGEGPNLVSGLGYNGVDKSGNHKWDGVTNIYPMVFETATAFQDIVVCFNVNTNAWVKAYVMKRLRFLGNKDLSNLGALLFLAIWHGLFPGYILAFVLEFFTMAVESYYAPIVNPITAKWYTPEATTLQRGLGYAWNFMRWFLVSAGLAQGLIPFATLTFPAMYEVFDSIHYVGLIPLLLGVPPLFGIDYLGVKKLNRAKKAV